MVKEGMPNLPGRNTAAVLCRHRGAGRDRAGRRIHSTQDREGIRRDHRGRLASRRRATRGRTRWRFVRCAQPAGRRRTKAPRAVEQLAEQMVQLGARPLQHGDRLRRRHRQRHGRIPGRDLHARHPGPADPHHPAGAGGRGHRRQDRRQPGQRQEPDRQLPPAARRAHRSRHPRYAARARIPRRPLRNHQGRHHPRTCALHLPGGIARRRAGPQTRGRGPHHRRERAHEGRSGFQRRTRRRPAPHPEFRPHLRPRAGGRDGVQASSCTARR